MYFLYRDLEWHRAVPVIFLLLHSLQEQAWHDRCGFFWPFCVFPAMASMFWGTLSVGLYHDCLLLLA